VFSFPTEERSNRLLLKVGNSAWSKVSRLGSDGVCQQYPVMEAASPFNDSLICLSFTSQSQLKA
jgi:hypothetical protein